MRNETSSATSSPLHSAKSFPHAQQFQPSPGAARRRIRRRLEKKRLKIPRQLFQLVVHAHKSLRIARRKFPKFRDRALAVRPPRQHLTVRERHQKSPDRTAPCAVHARRDRDRESPSGATCSRCTKSSKRGSPARFLPSRSSRPQFRGARAPASKVPRAPDTPRPSGRCGLRRRQSRRRTCVAEASGLV